MYLRAGWVATAAGWVSVSPGPSRRHTCELSFPLYAYPLPNTPRRPCIIRTQARKRGSQAEPVVVKPTILGEEDVPLDDLDDEAFMDNDDFEDEHMAEDAESYVGDGGAGGGISLVGTHWSKEALTIAENVSLSLDGDFKIYAFKTLGNATNAIQVRIEKMSNKCGSPCLNDLESFSSAYRARLDEAVIAGTVPKELTLEVSSPGVERVVRIPQDLDRFQDRPMYVKYRGAASSDDDSSIEQDGVFRLISFNLESSCCTWGLADVRINREKSGKGRPLNKRQREWRLNTPFDSLLLVRLYLDM